MYYFKVFNGKNYVFYRGKSNDKIYVSYSSDGSNWQGNFEFTAKDVATGPAATVFNGKIYVFYVDIYNRIKYYTSKDGITYSKSFFISKK